MISNSRLTPALTCKNDAIINYKDYIHLQTHNLYHLDIGLGVAAVPAAGLVADVDRDEDAEEGEDGGDDLGGHAEPVGHEPARANVLAVGLGEDLTHQVGVVAQG